MKWLLKFTLLTLISISAFGQTPEKMSYQAVIRDNSGILLENSNVSLKIVLRQGSPNGAVVYDETHNTKTNKNGLLSLEIGSGVMGKGRFNEINWAQGPFFIETYIDPQGNSKYKLNGMTEILSVPYALHAKSADSFTGIISPSQLPDFYTSDEIDEIFLNIISEETNASNFSGDYRELDNKPFLFSGLYSDLKNKPELYDKAEIDKLIQSIETTGVARQNLNLEGKILSISRGNSISFENWDTNAADDFSGIYDDLQNKPELFSGEYSELKNKPVLFSGLFSDLQNKPELYDKSEIDKLIEGIETGGGSSFSGLYDDLQNKPEIYNRTEIDKLIEGIETEGGSSFSGIYDDLHNKPELFSGEYSDLKNKPQIYDRAEIDKLIEGIESIGGSSFSGVYDDLENKPEIYNKTEIDKLIEGIETTGGSPQNLTLEGNTLTITGGNFISFENWDTNAADDFSGIYDDLQNKPENYNKTEIDKLIEEIEITGGSSFSGTYDDLQNKPELFSGEYSDLKSKPVLFSGLFADLKEKPELYNKSEIDKLIEGIETSGGTPQNLTLEGNTLKISGGNSISFENWDTNAADDFSGIYDDLENKPVLFSGLYADLKDKPELYNKTEIDKLIEGIEITGGSSFSGIYDDLQNKPRLFSGVYIDLQNKPEIYNKTEIDKLIKEIKTEKVSLQNLSIEGKVLTISGGNSISFENWDSNAADDFDGEYTSLKGAPKVYTQEEVDAIKAEILLNVKENYSVKARVVSLSSSRNINNNDVGNTIACISSATLTITSQFSGMQIGDVINLEVHDTTLTLKGASGVVINGKSSGTVNIGNNEAYRGGLIRKTADNSYIVL